MRKDLGGPLRSHVVLSQGRTKYNFIILDRLVVSG